MMALEQDRIYKMRLNATLPEGQWLLADPDRDRAKAVRREGL